MSGIDYKGIFSRVLYEEICTVFGAHGIDVITEDELDDIVAECLRKVYWPSVAEFRHITNQPSALPKLGWSLRVVPSSQLPNRRFA